MSKIQIERLKTDLSDLDRYINKVRKRGNINLVSKLAKKREFLHSRLAGAS